MSINLNLRKNKKNILLLKMDIRFTP